MCGVPTRVQFNSSTPTSVRSTLINQRSFNTSPERDGREAVQIVARTTQRRRAAAARHREAAATGKYFVFCSALIAQRQLRRSLSLSKLTCTHDVTTERDEATGNTAPSKQPPADLQPRR
jgi:hypothetical protein